MKLPRHPSRDSPNTSRRVALGARVTDPFLERRKPLSLAPFLSFPFLSYKSCRATRCMICLIRRSMRAQSIQRLHFPHVLPRKRNVDGRKCDRNCSTDSAQHSSLFLSLHLFGCCPHFPLAFPILRRRCRCRRRRRWRWRAVLQRRSPQHLRQVARHAEPGDVRAGPGAVISEQLRRRSVALKHGAYRRLQPRGGGSSPHLGCEDSAGPHLSLLLLSDIIRASNVVLYQ